MPILSLDSEALSAIAHGPARRRQRVREIIDNARRLQRETVLCAAVLAELIRGKRRDAAITSALKREHILVRDVDRHLAGMAGRLLEAARMGSRHAVDAFVAATVADQGGGIIVTGDPDDLGRLVAHMPRVHIVAI